MTLCALWVAVFVAMILVQGGFQQGGDLLSGGVSAATGDRFGSVTSAQVYAGQWWRALTATFIHYSLVHLFVNTAGLYQIGPLIESWYGSAAFLGLYAVLGVGGNLLAALSRPWIARQLAGLGNVHFPDYPCGGGSGVLCGLVALLAVVGWRSRSRFGDYLKAQMLGVLGFTAALGLMLPNVDNFGHAGGAVAGALVGLTHRRLVRLAGRPSARALGVAGGLLIAVAAGLQFRNPPPPPRPPADPRREVARLGSAMLQLVEVDRSLRTVAMLPAGGPPPYNVVHGVLARPTREEWLARGRANLDALVRGVPELAQGPGAADLETLRATLDTAGRRDLRPGELANAAACFGRLTTAVGNAWIAARGRLPAQAPRAVAPDAKRPPG
jgi:membrane associated rhomboid family serine protease